MAKCVCGREMLTAVGCAIRYVKIDGQLYQRIKYGAPNDLAPSGWVKPGMRCGDCGALPGHYHHWECDLERCPKCGEQLISCACENIYGVQK